MTTQHSKPLLIVQLASLVEIISDILFDPKKKKKTSLGTAESSSCAKLQGHIVLFITDQMRRGVTDRPVWTGGHDYSPITTWTST